MRLASRSLATATPGIHIYIIDGDNQLHNFVCGALSMMTVLSIYCTCEIIAEKND